MTEHLTLILIALIGSLSGLLALFIGRHKLLAEVNKLAAEADSVKADEAEKLTGIAMRLMDELRSRLEESEATAQRQDEALQARIGELERLSREQADAIRELSGKLERALNTVRALLRGTATLIHQVTKLGAVPDYVIPLYGNGDDLNEIEKVLLRGLGD